MQGWQATQSVQVEEESHSVCAVWLTESSLEASSLSDVFSAEDGSLSYSSSFSSPALSLKTKLGALE